METLVRRSAARGGAEWACGRRPGAAVPAGATRPPAPRALGGGGGAGCACLSYLPEGWGTWRETAPLAEPPCPTVVGPAHMADPPPPSSSPPGFPFPTSGLCRKWPVPPLPAARAAPPPPPGPAWPITVTFPALGARQSCQPGVSQRVTRRAGGGAGCPPWGTGVAGSGHPPPVTWVGGGPRGQMEPAGPGRAGLVGPWPQGTQVAAGPCMGSRPMTGSERENRKPSAGAAGAAGAVSLCC